MLQLPATEVDLLMRYWAEEPWGPYRDNLHAAILAVEVRRTLTPKAKIELERFMITHPKRRARRNARALVETLKAMAGGVRKHVSEVKPRKRSPRRKP